MNLWEVMFGLGLLFIVGGILLLMTSKREFIATLGIVVAAAGIVAVLFAVAA